MTTNESANKDSFYVLWTNRNGQHHWSGPFVGKGGDKAAMLHLEQIIDCQKPVLVREVER